MGCLVVVSVAHCAGVCSAVGAHGWNINESNVCLAWPDRLCPGVSTAVRAPLGVWWCQERAGAWCVWVVFGALLGPEATGPFCSNAFGALLVFLLFLLPVSPVAVSSSAPFVGVGCGVRGSG